MRGQGAGRTHWTFLTNHAHVLLCLLRDPTRSLREVAAAVGITERATQDIVADLEDGGFLERRRVGRRNEYTLHTDLPLRHPLERDHTIGELLETLRSNPTGQGRPGPGDTGPTAR